MLKVNAVDSFCDMKLASSSGNGEKKLYLSKTDSLDFVVNYLGISIAKGHNIYQYNDEIRTRTKGYMGFVTKSNLQDVFNRSVEEYSKNDKYRVDLTALRRKNQDFLDTMKKEAYFQIDCSISEDRIYIGSQDRNWLAIPSFCIPKESKVKIINLNDSDKIEFRIKY